jgi:hypothetical protein
MTSLQLPTPDGRLAPFRFTRPSPFALAHSGSFPRTVYAAAHVVADPLRLAGPWEAPAIDWDATLAFRRHLWGLGFKIAEAMDTSQRGMGLDWPGARDLIARSLAEARTIEGADLACGAGTEQLDIALAETIEAVIAAYEVQMEWIERHGGRMILMASRALCKVARGPEDYVRVYDRLIAQSQDKVILHWLGAMFDPHLAGYWGSDDVATAMDVVVDLIQRNASKIDGIKISLLEAAHEVELRRRLPAGVVMYTGDDFNYAELMAGDDQGYSHGLLGIFDPIAPAAAAALDRLAAGDRQGYHAILDPTVPLSRRIFEAPTRYYKAGVVFLAWLNGFQDHFRMVGGMESARGLIHYADVARLADAAGLIVDTDRAQHRLRAFMTTQGIG